MKNFMMLAMFLGLGFISNSAFARCVNKDPDFCCRTIGGSYCNNNLKIDLQVFMETASANSWTDGRLNYQETALKRINEDAQSHCQDTVKRISEYKFNDYCGPRPYGDERVDYCRVTVTATFQCEFFTP